MAKIDLTLTTNSDRARELAVILRAGLGMHVENDACDLAEWLVQELEEAADLCASGKDANMFIVDAPCIHEQRVRD